MASASSANQACSLDYTTQHDKDYKKVLTVSKFPSCAGCAIPRHEFKVRDGSSVVRTPQHV